MSVGGEVLIVGPYTLTYDSVSLGLIQGEGGLPTITSVGKAKSVGPSNRYGATTIDSIHQGRDCFIDMILMEYLKGLSALWPFGDFWSLGTIGVLKYALAKPLVMTAVAGTSAANTPATLTMLKTILADDHQGKLVYGPELRTVPLRLQVYPFDRNADLDEEDPDFGVQDLAFAVET